MTFKDTRYEFKLDLDNKLLLRKAQGVFSPTGTSALLIEAARDNIKKPGRLLDLACGSGVIGLFLYKLGLLKPPLYASDLSCPSVACAKKNAALHNCPVEIRRGSLFEPWKNEKFDYIINDVAGIAEDVAKISPWYKGVPCRSGIDGTLLVTEIIEKAPGHLSKKGVLFFPVISLSNTEKILKTARNKFPRVKRLLHKEWLLPEKMNKYAGVLEELRNKKYIRFSEKFGMTIWFTDIYAAYKA
ncbi:MAG: methyltransferase [Candidatus Omnitrophica bacterium]|nr:methyltransferase [Candidatus Omnitrophota bacterium]